MEKNKVLEIKNLTFGYTKDRLLYNDFNLDVSKGEVVSIVGPSGSGKSTLFELILKNLKPLKGEIKSKNVSIVYQDPYNSFHPSYSILNQIKDYTNNNLEQIDIFLEKLNLDRKLIHKKPHELSGGQLQRCSILRSLLYNPDLLLIDEPTSALDNIIALDSMKLLLTFLDKVGILLITHDLYLSRWCSDKIIDLSEESKFFKKRL